MQRVSAVTRQKFIDLIRAEATGDWSTWNERNEFAKRVLRYGTTYGRIQETACNSPEHWSNDAAVNKQIAANWQEMLDRNEKKAERIEAKLTALCAKYGIKPIFQGDPRGNTIKLQVPSGKTDDWGREGICVPTS